MNWIIENFATFLIFLGILLILIEVAFLGLGVFILLFIGVACIIDGLLVAIGMVPATMGSTFGLIAVITLLLAGFLWKPLKKLQNDSETKEEINDFIGTKFYLESDISLTHPGTHRLSGIDWKVTSNKPLKAGIEVSIVKVEVGVLTVAAV